MDFMHPIFPSGEASECCDKFEATRRGVHETEVVHNKADKRMECKNLRLLFSSSFLP